MEEWRLIDLGSAEPLIAQTFYEAVAEAVHRGESPSTLILVQPEAPYACIGYHQDLEKEIDLGFLEEAGLPVIRRSQGGGATYLDGNQVFYQIIAGDSGAIPRGVDRLFERLLAVTVEGYRRLGVPAEFKPLNDVVVEGRKISGNGAGMHGSATILVGNFIMDLDYDLMARVLRVPDEKFRDKMAKTMRQWVSTLKRELGEPPSPDVIKAVYIDAFQKIMGVNLVRGEPTELEWRIYEEETKPLHTSRDWLYMESPSREGGRAVKIAHDVKVVEADHKAGKLIRVRAEVKGDEIVDVNITGDFFIIPKEAVNTLEDMLRGAKLEHEVLEKIAEDFYGETGAQSPGVTPRDFAEALMKLRQLP